MITFERSARFLSNKIHFKAVTVFQTSIEIKCLYIFRILPVSGPKSVNICLEQPVLCWSFSEEVLRISAPY